MCFVKKVLCFLYQNSIWFQGVSLFAVRCYIAKVFFQSGLTKLSNWSTTLALFEDEYQVPILSAEWAAYLATSAELIFPILLVLGFLTPLAAFGLLIMTLVIEIFIYPGATEHYYWLLLTGVLLTHGAGKFSMDSVLQRYFNYKCTLATTANTADSHKGALLSGVTKKKYT
ncbi:MAG: DoxX family protein [Pseudomonadota bacterium]